MTTARLNNFGKFIILLLVALIIIGGVVIWIKYSPGQPLEISLPPEPEWQGQIYIGGAVANPGFYPMQAGDTMEALIQAAGGATSANLSGIRLYILTAGEGQEPQKVDLNRAEVWLLEALPGIGETMAQRIVDYRQQNGPFRNVDELRKVAGIGTATLDRIKTLITVTD